MIGAAVGMIIGILAKSGLGFALTLVLSQIGSGNFGLLLLLAAFVCIILGMGMPTIGVYVLVATLVAPAMIEVGVSPMAAHMYVLYFGMLSFITPITFPWAPTKLEEVRAGSKAEILRDIGYAH